MFIAALFIIVKIRKQPKCPSMDELIKNDIIIFFSHKKSKILPFAATWMDTEGIILSEIGEKEKNK